MKPNVSHSHILPCNIIKFTNNKCFLFAICKDKMKILYKNQS